MIYIFYIAWCGDWVRSDSHFIPRNWYKLTEASQICYLCDQAV